MIGGAQIRELYPDTRPRLALLSFTFVLLIQLTLVLGTAKGISWDPSYGLLAAQQHRVGMSPSIFKLVEADPVNISQLVETPVSYWAPAYQFIPYAFRFFGFSWGESLNLTLAVALIVGAIGWFKYFARIFGSTEFACWLSALLALTRFRWTMALTYDGGDQLIWAASPWVLISAATAFERIQERDLYGASVRSGLAGALGASLFALKFSGVFVAIGSAAVFASLCVKRRYWMMLAFAGFGFSAVILAIYSAGFPQGVTPANSTKKLDVLQSIAVFGMPAVGATDLDRLLRPFLSNIALSEITTGLLIGLALTLVTIVGLTYFVTNRSIALPCGDRLLSKLAIGAVIADVMIVFMLMLRGANVTPEGRFGRVSGLLLLPIVMVGWLKMLRDNRLIWRYFAITSTVIFLFLPVIFATGRQLPTVIDRLRNDLVEVDREGVINLELTPGTDTKAFYKEIASIHNEGLLYTIYPQMAFPIAWRTLILDEAEEQETISTLSAKTYHGNPAGGITLLVPRSFEFNGKLDAIKSSFVDISRFQRHELRSDPKWVLWVGSN